VKVVLRWAGEDDAARLAVLKIEWAAAEPSEPEREAFAQAMAEWMDRHRDDVVCAVAEVDGRLVGMAWMVVYDRVPDLGQIHRMSADVQSVYVRSPHRGLGIGRRLVGMLCDDADRRGIPRVTVHSSSRAISLYERAGFTRLPKLLARELASL